MEEMLEVVEGKVDWKGRSAFKQKHGGTKSSLLALVTYGFDQMANFALAVNLTTYFNTVMHLELADAANQLTNYMGTCYILSIPMAVLADTCLGRVKTVIISGCLEFLALILLMIQAHYPKLKPPLCNIFDKQSHCETVGGAKAALLYVPLYALAIGNAGIKAALPPHGADQFDEKDPKEAMQISSFFNQLLLGSSLGIAASLTLVVWIQDNKGWDWGFGVSSAAILFGIVMFVAGLPLYRMHIISGSNAIVQVLQVYVAATRNRNLVLPEDPADLYEIERDKEAVMEEDFLPHRNICRFLDKAAIQQTPCRQVDTPEASSPWKLCTVTQVENAKVILSMIPIFCCTVNMSLCFAQLQTFSIQQGLTMDTKLTPSFNIPPPSLTIIPVFFLILMAPIYDKILVPFARKFTGIPTGITPLQRVGVGLVLSIISMAVAALVEVKRKGVARDHNMLDATPVLPEERNRPLTDEELDALFPATGYKILDPPASYVPIRTPSRKLLATPTPMGQTPGFAMQATPAREDYGVPMGTPLGSDGSAMPFIKPEDYQYFGKLMDEVNEEDLDPEAAMERKIMQLLLKIKNGTPPQRKTALRQLTDKAREFGAGALFNQILPLLMAPTLEDQERHLLVKVIDRVLYKLDDLVRPYVHKILVVIEPLLIDEDYYARVEGREIISNLAKAAGLATMISTMRPDIDIDDEYVRNTTARAFAVVASALGIPALLPFLKAVCQSRKSWQARHTGIKIVQQVAILMGCAVLPHLKHLVEIIEHGLEDEQKVRTITALALAALAEAAHPYGIESFDSVLRPLWRGTRKHHGKGLAAFLKAIGFIIPLMDTQYANYYTVEVMEILIREFQSPDEEMKKIVLKVVKQCVSTDGVEASYVKEKILPEFFRHFWVRRMALDRRNYRQLVETTVELANNVGASEIISRVVDDLKDESEPYRRMVMEAIQKIISNLGATDIGTDLEEKLIDGILYAFQEQTSDDTFVMLNGFGIVVNALGIRAKNYLPQICGTIKWRLNNKPAKVRMQAADLINRIAVVMKTCDQEPLMGHMGVVLYEYLGEEYPEVLGSILGALKAIVNVIGMSKMTPPIKDLLPRLTPILKNRHEKVQENCIDLVGRIADRGADLVSAREWMRICFELLDMLKAHKKGIRRAAVNTFGYIAKAIGPQDVLHTLLNNLKVQERQNRVCTTVAIAIVAETCSPFTVVPALMNEYRVPELNVQNGVLKAFSFMFEYIGEMGKDYIYAVAPLLQDALMDRDLVHRQTACTTVKHLALGVVGLGCEDALVHLLNFVWPNIFETSPHVINAVFEAVEGCRVALGPHVILQYVLQGLFHPARRVREVYWKIYNSLYMYAQDGLTPAYPMLEDDGVNSYNRTYLELCI